MDSFRYCILSDSYIDGLMAKVNGSMHDGWTPLGGVCAYMPHTMHNAVAWYCQAMVKLPEPQRFASIDPGFYQAGDGARATLDAINRALPPRPSDTPPAGPNSRCD